MATSKATGIGRTATTDGAGMFTVNALSPGEYEVTVSAKGFGTTVSQVRLEVGQQQDLKVRLQLKSEQVSVNINSADTGPLVNTTSSIVDGVISSEQIDSLPLNGRNFLELSLLVPGNAPAPNFDPTKSDTVVISTDGQLGRGGNVTIDGADNNDDTVGGMLHNVPEDAVQEFQIASNQYSAALGRSGSAVVNVVTKSGTNAWHGTAAIFARDEALQASSPLVDPSLGTPPFRREQYAGSVGGPVIKNKAWFYSAFEYRDQVGGVPVGFADLNNADDHQELRLCARHRRIGHCARRLADQQQRQPDDALLYRAAQRHRRKFTRSRLRLGFATSGARKQVPGVCH